MTITRHLRPASLALIVAALIGPLGAGLAYADEIGRSRAERREGRPDNRREMRRQEPRGEVRQDRRERVRERRDAVRGDRRETRREVRQEHRNNRSDFRQDRRDIRADRRESRPNIRHDRGEYRRDVRQVSRHGYRHYPRRGTVIRSLPRERHVITHRRSRYYFSNGAWYRPHGGRFVVIAPPIGIVVPILPYGYVTMHIGSNAYYLANDVYYVRRPNGYVVVEPPTGAPARRDDDYSAGQDQIYIYPREGQSAQQQATDRYDCHSWARDETGFDPTRQFADLSDEQIDDLRSDYHRAMGACLDARGYTVR